MVLPITMTAWSEGRGNTDHTELNEDPLSSRRKRYLHSEGGETEAQGA